MVIKKLAPWNWFKKEEDAGSVVPVQRQSERHQDYTHAHPLGRFHREVDRFFDQAYRGFGVQPMGRGWPILAESADALLKPTLDLSATEKEYKIAVEVPGVAAEDVKLEIVDDTLTIRGEKKCEKEDKGKNYYRMERSYGAFQRILSLPEDADQDNVSATFKNGVLTVTMNRKAAPRENIRQIEVMA